MPYPSLQPFLQPYPHHFPQPYPQPYPQPTCLVYSQSSELDKSSGDLAKARKALEAAQGDAAALKSKLEAALSDLAAEKQERSSQIKAQVCVVCMCVYVCLGRGWDRGGAKLMVPNMVPAAAAAECTSLAWISMLGF
jgi:hypothetical protein